VNVFIVIIEDRHSDTQVEVFSGEVAAVEHAKAVVKEYGRYPEDISEGLTEPMTRAGWLYHATYSCEGDNVRVERKTIDGAEAP